MYSGFVGLGPWGDVGLEFCSLGSRVKGFPHILFMIHIYICIYMYMHMGFRVQGLGLVVQGLPPPPHKQDPPLQGGHQPPPAPPPPPPPPQKDRQELVHRQNPGVASPLAQQPRHFRQKSTRRPLSREGHFRRPALPLYPLGHLQVGRLREGLWV